MMTYPLRMALLVAMVLSLVTLTGCSTAPAGTSGKAELEADARAALLSAQREDPSLTPLLREVPGFAVFPNVGKGAVGVGGAYGRGVLYENDRIVGYCDLSQGTIGFQLGGQAYTEIIVFETREALRDFKSGNLEFTAQATAVALQAGAGSNAQFDNGVAVFTVNEEGLMYEAAIGGQKFSYQPKAGAPAEAEADLYDPGRSM